MENKPQQWFEMSEIKKRFFNKNSWIPLKESITLSREGENGHIGFTEEYFGIGSIIVPLPKRNEAEKLGWTDIGTRGATRGYVEGEEYIPSYIFKDNENDLIGENLVIERPGNSIECSEWHLNTDLIVTLNLKREGDLWLAIDYGYEEVIKLGRNENGCPNSLYIKASYLKDYLCARKTALYLTSYRSRVQITKEAPHINWPNNEIVEKKEGDRWEGRVIEIHEGGNQFGGGFAIMHVSRNDIDFEEDIPELGFPEDENTTMKKTEGNFKGCKLYRIWGELWRNEWVEPAEISPIVGYDDVASTSSFYTDNSGNMENGDSLDNGKSRWLWFKPSVVNEILSIRRSSLSWYTKNTGGIGCSSGEGVHFGINKLGLINVYAKDIGLLPNWQQKIWAGYNLIPDGKVSAELLMSQMKAEPAKTFPPEDHIQRGIDNLNFLSEEKYGIKIINDHSEVKNILPRTHRFRATNKAGMLELAKDLHRLIGERINISEIKKILKEEKNTFGTLKSLERLLSIEIGEDKAKKIMSPLHGIYALRNSDSHLSSEELSEALSLCEVNETDPLITQGQQLIHATVLTVAKICQVLNNKNEK